MSYDRITKADIERAFHRAFGESAATDIGAGGTNAHNIGKYALDHNGVYGGWVVICFSGGDSGAGWCQGSTPWGPARRPGRSFFDWLQAYGAGRDAAVQA